MSTMQYRIVEPPAGRLYDQLVDRFVTKSARPVKVSALHAGSEEASEACEDFILTVTVVGKDTNNLRNCYAVVCDAQGRTILIQFPHPVCEDPEGQVAFDLPVAQLAPNGV